MLALLDEPEPGQAVRAIPGAGTRVPVWILGSSRFGAQLAAALGLPYAFASHFAPGELMAALADYREHFRPSRFLDRPHAMVGFNAYVADTDEEARFHASSMEQAFVALRHGRPGPIPPPVAGYRESASRFERAVVEQTMACSAIGSPETVEREIEAFLKGNSARSHPWLRAGTPEPVQARLGLRHSMTCVIVRQGIPALHGKLCLRAEFPMRTGADELIVTNSSFDHAARRRSCELLAGVRNRIAARTEVS